MTDYIAKARAGRTLAINIHRSGAVMFFPEDIVEVAPVATRQIVTSMVKPMFVRSAALHPSAEVKAPSMDQVANAQPFVLTEEHAVTPMTRAA